METTDMEKSSESNFSNVSGQSSYSINTNPAKEFVDLLNSRPAKYIKLMRKLFSIKGKNPVFKVNFNDIEARRTRNFSLVFTEIGLKLFSALRTSNINVLSDVVNSEFRLHESSNG